MSKKDTPTPRGVGRRKSKASSFTVLDGGSHPRPPSSPSALAAGADVINAKLHDASEPAPEPEAAKLASLGCSNPLAVASLNPGEIVLNLGSAEGVDILLSAKRVGLSGFVYGLDMTKAMLAEAEKKKRESGLENIAFLRGSIEHIPLPDETIDVIISNGIINISADKNKVFKEAFRVLKPGGRLAVADIVIEGDLPAAIRLDVAASISCIATALERDDCEQKLHQAGFEGIQIDPFRRYTVAELEKAIGTKDAGEKISDEERVSLDGRIISAFIRAEKPILEAA